LVEFFGEMLAGVDGVHRMFLFSAQLVGVVRTVWSESQRRSRLRPACHLPWRAERRIA
jgi:hypothetical protein